MPRTPLERWIVQKYAFPRCTLAAVCQREMKFGGKHCREKCRADEVKRAIAARREARGY